MQIRNFVVALVVLSLVPLARAASPHVVFLIGEREYETAETLPRFARDVLVAQDRFRCTFVHADATKRNSFPGIEAIKKADLLVLSVRRRSLPEQQLAVVRGYLNAGRPLVGIRTASHAFDTKGQHPDGHAEWRNFDPEVLGGHYVGHHGNKKITTVSLLPSAAKHPVLAGLSGKPFRVGGSLYRVNPLKSKCTPLLSGQIEGAPAEPVAWTHVYKGGRVFYTSLGHPADFRISAFRRLLHNGILWALKHSPREKPLK